MPNVGFLATQETGVTLLKVIGLANDATLVSEYGSLVGTPKDAGDARAMSGDLVLDPKTGDLCLDDGWLWDWERENPMSYAWRELQKARYRAEKGLKPRWCRPSFEERLANYKSQKIVNH